MGNFKICLKLIYNIFCLIKNIVRKSFNCNFGIKQICLEILKIKGTKQIDDKYDIKGDKENREIEDVGDSNEISQNKI